VAGGLASDVSLLEEDHVDDLRRRVPEPSLVSGGEVQREYFLGIDHCSVVVVKLPTLWRADLQRVWQPNPIRK